MNLNNNKKDDRYCVLYLFSILETLPPVNTRIHASAKNYEEPLETAVECPKIIKAPIQLHFCKKKPTKNQKTDITVVISTYLANT